MAISPLQLLRLQNIGNNLLISLKSHSQTFRKSCLLYLRNISRMGQPCSKIAAFGHHFSSVRFKLNNSQRNPLKI